jgi:tRNA(Ser,Leu) C12 N-acetylase TAN1
MTRPPVHNKKKYHAKKKDSSAQKHPQQTRAPRANNNTNQPATNNSNNHHKKKKSSTTTTRRRGGPGMLLTCEAGREAQCCREALQILQHYYERQLQQKQQQQQQPSENDNTNDKTRPNDKEKEKMLTMDEEIAMLQQQQHNRAASSNNAPFSMYDTGSRGTVFLLCTLPDCALIPLSILLQAQRAAARTITNSDFNFSKEQDTEETNDEELLPNDDTVKNEIDHEPANEGTNSKKRFCNDTASEEKDREAVAVGDAGQDGTDSKKRKTNEDYPDTEHPTTKESLNHDKLSSPDGLIKPPPWDPIATIHSIIHDLSSPLSSSMETPPSSRFVTRMIPMQATCYASLEEIRILGRALIQRYLNEVQGKSHHQSTTTPSSSSSSSGSTSSRPPQSFAIMVKRRICSNVTRDAIIDALATEVMNSTSQKTTSDSTIQPTTPDDSNSDPRNDPSHAAPTPLTWKVDLKHPDMIIQVEICKTLCGISVFSGQDHRTLYHNFNLIEIRTQHQLEVLTNSSS